jgi:hypothetical protein
MRMVVEDPTDVYITWVGSNCVGSDSGTRQRMYGPGLVTTLGPCSPAVLLTALAAYYQSYLLLLGVLFTTYYFLLPTHQQLPETCPLAVGLQWLREVEL